MSSPRRNFLRNTAALAAATALSPGLLQARGQGPGPPDYTDLDRELARPVLRRAFFPDPVIINTVELLEYGGSYLCRVRSTDGAEGLVSGHNIRNPSPAIPNAGPYHEFKGVGEEVPFECATSTLVPQDGILHLPRGTGSGVVIDPEFVAKHKVVG